ncbi:hypothetical protein VTN02DRAFT_5703 [Thermoascus thermophilus]
MAARRNKRANLAIARIIPVLVIGAFAYASYAVTKPLCVDYLIHPYPDYSRSPRVGAGAAIIAVYYVLLFPVIVTYLRLLYTVIWKTGFLPRGAQWKRERDEAEESAGHHRKRRRRRKREKAFGPAQEKIEPQPQADVESGLDYTPGKAFPFDASGLESFYSKDVFVCMEDGRPPYCSKCSQFKTDRAHHCREVDRCVRKMDHFCPWVGGVVSETSFKFFIQFVFYTAVFCIFNIIVLSIFVAELRREEGHVNAHWLVVLGLSCLFGLFAAGMTGSSLQLAMHNLTTIENLSRRSKVWTLAVYIPRPDQIEIDPETQWAATFPTVSYPKPRTSPELRAQDQEPKPDERRVFAILRTRPGENPFDLGSRLKNLQQVMGYTVADWLLPLKQSPCADHSSLESAFALGPVVQRLREEAGLVEPRTETGRDDSEDHQDRRHRHRHRRRGRKMKRAERSRSSRRGDSGDEGASTPEIQRPPKAHHRQVSDTSTDQSIQSNPSDD